MASRGKFIHHEVGADGHGKTLEVYMKEVLGISARNRQKLFYNGGVLVNRRKAHTKLALKLGDKVQVREMPDTDYSVEPQVGELDILYEDDYLIILNKPAGVAVHPAWGVKDGTLANFLAGYYQIRGSVIKVRPMHRLDFGTSGCIVFAKSTAVQNALNEQLATRQMHRNYVAIVEHKFIDDEKSGTIMAPIAIETPPNGHKRVVRDDGKPSITHYRVMKEIEEPKHCSLVMLKLDTGRTHQIRVHMAHIGHPVLGDTRYGTKSELIAHQALHAISVEFTHPITGKKVFVETGVPADFRKILAQL